MPVQRLPVARRHAAADEGDAEAAGLAVDDEIVQLRHDRAPVAVADQEVETADDFHVLQPDVAQGAVDEH